MIFYLGAYKTHWLAAAGVPLCLSRGVLALRKTLPRAKAPWILDSGAFTEISTHGRWRLTPREYVAQVRRFAGEIGSLDWAAPQDWMCEPWILQKTGLSVAEHQRRSTDSYLELCVLAPEIHWIPVLQGWTLPDYFAHVEGYAHAGVELQRAPTVGLGSVCRRQRTGEIAIIVRALAELGLRLHGFGVKLIGLEALAPLLASADSMSWSYQARRNRGLAGCRHRRCQNCLRYALRWLDRVHRRLSQVEMHW